MPLVEDAVHGLTGDRRLIDGYFASHLHLHIDIDIDIYMCVRVCVTLGGQPRPTPRAAPTQVSPRHKTPTVVWRATVSRLGGERVRRVGGLCGSVSLSRASRRIPSPEQSAAASSGAAFGRTAASCPAPARRLLARPRPASHSWAHPFPPHHTAVRAAPATSSDLPVTGKSVPRARSLFRRGRGSRFLFWAYAHC